MSSSPPPQRKGPDISGAQVAGTALAAVSAAVVASFLGVGGTILGAALGSIVASVGGALYSHSFRRAADRLGDTKVLTVVTRPRVLRTAPGPGDVPVIEDAAADDDQPPYAESGRESADQPAQPVEVAEPGRLPPPGGRIPRWLSWKAAVALTVVAFVLAIAAIEVVELVIGRPISGGSGGTTISKLVKPDSSRPKAPKPTPTTPVSTPAPTPTATSTPTTTATQPSPSDSSSTGSATSTGPVGPSGTPTG
jgi:hypothetical protein